jgi:hypothetical protein
MVGRSAQPGKLIVTSASALLGAIMHTRSSCKNWKKVKNDPFYTPDWKNLACFLQNNHFPRKKRAETGGETQNNYSIFGHIRV